MSRRERSLDLVEVAGVAHKVIFIMSGIKLLKHLSLVLDAPGVNVDTYLLFGAFYIILNRFSRDYRLLLLTWHGYHDYSEAPAHDCVAAEEVIVSLNESTRALYPSIQPIG